MPGSWCSRRARRGTAGLTLAILLLTSTLAACTAPPSPDPVAGQLASALTTGDFSAVPLDGGVTAAMAAKDFAEVTAGMPSPPVVVLKDVAPTEGRDDVVTATMTATWDLPSTEVAWSYSVPATLTLRDDVWRATWTRAVIAPELTPQSTLRVDYTEPRRADITGAGGRTIVTARPVYQVGIDKAKVSKATARSSARDLAQIVGIDADSYVERVTAGGAQQFVVAITLRATDPVITTRADDIAAVPGASQVPDTLPLAPTRTFARELLGVVGPATAEVVEQSKGAILADQIVGLTGLQARYDEQLRGTLGVTVQAVSTTDGGTATAVDLVGVPTGAGRPLETTLDIATQRAAEKALADVTGTGSALVAIRPSTGEVLAAANGPGSKGLALATSAQAEPGSTFKVVSSLAALRTGMSPTSLISCPRTITVDGRTFKNYSDYPSPGIGRITLRTALANSCNTAFISLHRTVEDEQLAQAADALGLGVDHDLGFASFMGSTGPADTDDAPTTTERAAALIGQGKVLASPLAMASVMASVVEGTVVRPVLVPSESTDHPAPTTPLTPAEAKDLRTMMRAVVTEGSGRGLAASGVTMAKSGTAEFGSATPPKTHTWMVAARGDLAVAAYVEVGQSGARTAGPLVTAFLAALDG